MDRSAPLTSLLLGENSITGTLPDNTLAGASLGQLVQQNLTHNKLQGTVPLAWVEAGGVLSHVTLLDLGDVWGDSLKSVGWRQQLCLKKELYDPDVTGQNVALLPEVQKHLQNVSNEIENGFDVDTSNAAFWAEAFLYVHVENEDNQLSSIREVCANAGSKKILLIALLSFGSCCLLMILVYTACVLAARQQQVQLKQPACMQLCSRGVLLLFETS